MSLTRKDIDHVALLSRLELDDETSDKMAQQLGRVLDYIAKLNELDTTDVEPMSHPGDLVNVFREDAVAESLDRDDVLANAPDRTKSFFRVPKIIE